MKTILIFKLCLISIIFNINGQIDTTLNFDKLDKKITIYQKEWGDLQKLIIKDVNGDVIKKIELDKKEIDPYRIGDYYIGERNFIVIAGLHKFYIFIVSTDRLIGPLRCCCRNEIQDAQTGGLGAFKIINNGQYLLVGSCDNGPYCFDLQDLYNPKEVDYYSQEIPYQSEFLFIDKREENIYNGIFATYKNYSGTIYYKFLFHGYRFEQNENGDLIQKTDSNGFLLLNKLDGHKNTTELKIDLKNGEILK